jgi:hypothetical protein
MSKHHEAFNTVMDELKERIKGHSSDRLRRKAADPVHGGEHEEPDGDEDASGQEPAGPEEEYTGEAPEGLETVAGTQFDKNKKLPKEEANEEGCGNCGHPRGSPDDKYCSGCGQQHR